MKFTAPKTLRVVLLLAFLIRAQPAHGLHPAGSNSPLIIQSSSQISQQAITGQDVVPTLRAQCGRDVRVPERDEAS